MVRCKMLQRIQKGFKLTLQAQMTEHKISSNGPLFTDIKWFALRSIVSGKGSPRGINCARDSVASNGVEYSITVRSAKRCSVKHYPDHMLFWSCSQNTDRTWSQKAYIKPPQTRRHYSSRRGRPQQMIRIGKLQIALEGKAYGANRTSNVYEETLLNVSPEVAAEGSKIVITQE